MGNVKNARLHRIWNDMKQRCGNQNNTVYSSYGGRGISVCDMWRDSYKDFKSWALNHGYAETLTLDRIDYNDGYYPDNCRWITRKEQARNRRDNHIIEFNGKTQTLAEWAEELGISDKTLWARLKKWPVERALTEKTHSEFSSKSLTYKNITHTIWEWARIFNLKPTTLTARLKRGWPLEKALMTPVKERA